MTPTEIRKMLAHYGFDTAADFTVLSPLVNPQRFGRARLTHAEIVHLIELGFTTAPDIAAVHGEPVDEYAALGVTTVEEILFASKRRLTPPVIATYRKHDVVDLPAMATLKRAGVGATTVAAYARIPGFTLDAAARLKEAGVSAKAARDLLKLGADSVDTVIAMSHFTTEQIELMSRFGFAADQVREPWASRCSAVAARLVAADPTITPAEILSTRGRPGWVELIEATPHWRDWREPAGQDPQATTELVQAGATVDQAVKLLIEPTQKQRNRPTPLGASVTRRALQAGFTPAELVELVDRHANLTTAWSYRRSTTALPRSDFEAALRAGVNLTDLVDWRDAVPSATPEQVAELIGGGWRPPVARGALRAGFSVADLIASPLKVEEPEPEPEEDEAEAPRGPGEWDW